MQLELGRGRWRLTSRGRIDLKARFGRADLRVGEWSNLYADIEANQLAALGEDGSVLVECDLETWIPTVGTRSGEVVRRTLRSPARRKVLSGFEIHSSIFETEVFAEAWIECDSFSATERLEEAARGNREFLLERLPRRFAHAIHPARVRSIFDELSGQQGLRLDAMGRGHRTEFELEELDVCSAGSVTVVHARSVDAVLNWGEIAGAYLVRLPVNGAIVRAVEVVDSRGDVMLRIRRSLNASPPDVFAWRAILDEALRR